MDQAFGTQKYTKQGVASAMFSTQSMDLKYKNVGEDLSR